jgi:hypothetical protein
MVLKASGWRHRGGHDGKCRHCWWCREAVVYIDVYGMLATYVDSGRGYAHRLCFVYLSIYCVLIIFRSMQVYCWTYNDIAHVSLFCNTSY